MEFNILVGMVCTVVGLLISWLAFSRNRDKDKKSEGAETGTILTEIGYIKANTDEIKVEQRRQTERNTEFYTRLATVEASAKQAHQRIDRIEGKEDSHDKTVVESRRD